MLSWGTVQRAEYPRGWLTSQSSRNTEIQGRGRCCLKNMHGEIKEDTQGWTLTAMC